MEKVKLGEIALLINGDRGKNYPSQEDITDDGEVPFVNAGHLNGKNIDYSDMNYISQEKYEKLSSGKFEKGDILYCLRGSLGKKAIVNDEVRGAIASSLVIIRPDRKKVNGDYLMFSLDAPTIREQLTKANNGSTQPNLSASSVREFRIELPTLLVQKDVVEKLTKLQHVIEKRQNQINLLDKLVKARFVEMFGSCLNKVLIGDVISICRGASPRPIQAYITESLEGVNWIKIGDVSENSLYITKTAEKITLEGAKKSRAVHAGNFILSNSMSFGRPYILGIDGYVHDGWLILSNFRDTFNELYLYYALRNEYVQQQFHGKVNGATVKNLNSDLVKATYIQVPDMYSQKVFADFVKQVDKSKVAIQKSLAETQLLFDKLMQDYFG